MIETITKTRHPEHPAKFREAVRDIFSILCFTPDQTDQELVQQLALPELAADIRDTPYEEGQLMRTIEVYGQAHEGNRQALAGEEREHFRGE